MSIGLFPAKSIVWNNYMVNVLANNMANSMANVMTEEEIDLFTENNIPCKGTVTIYDVQYKPHYLQKTFMYICAHNIELTWSIYYALSLMDPNDPTPILRRINF